MGYFYINTYGYKLGGMTNITINFAKRYCRSDDTILLIVYHPLKTPGDKTTEIDSIRFSINNIIDNSGNINTNEEEKQIHKYLNKICFKYFGY